MAGQGEEQEPATNLSSPSPLSQAGTLPPLLAPQASSGEASEAGLGASIDGNLKQNDREQHGYHSAHLFWY